jgi:hypothetical protein
MPPTYACPSLTGRRIAALWWPMHEVSVSLGLAYHGGACGHQHAASYCSCNAPHLPQ